MSGLRYGEDEIYPTISALLSNPQNSHMVQLLLSSSFMDEETKTPRVFPPKPLNKAPEL